jgi:hypothetical protein
MDLTNLLIALDHIAGNVIFFWGFFKLLSLTVFKANRKAKEPDIEEEVERIERELKRM